MIAGHATAEGTARYAVRFAGQVPGEYFRPFADELRLSTLGIGTYLGREDAATDASYEKAIVRALERGINVIDTAVNYRHQRSERAIGAALARVLGQGRVRRDEFVVATKGGFLPFDGQIPSDPNRYFSTTYVQPGIVRPGDVVGSHCMTPRYLADQIERSRANLGLETIDIYYLHNPEAQLDELERDEVMRRLRVAFEALETAARDGRIRWYGTATWNGYRTDPDQPGYLSLPDVMAAAREVGGDDHRFRVIQLPYNLAMPEAFTRANQKAEDGLVPPLEAARRLGLYVMASASVYQGQLTRNLPSMVGEYLPGLATDGQRALQFVRSTPGIGTALVGMKSVAHVEENAKVVTTPPVPWAQFQRFFTAA
jgi:aryl-alcohol dehydrogenase-like predicted oxidoreductase